MRNQELTALFLRYRAGDVGALAMLFDRTAPKLLRIARRLVRDKTEVDDLLQATYLAVIERSESFDGTRRFEPWLVGILANQAGLARRRATRTIEPARLWRTNTPEPCEVASEREIRNALEQALEGLPPMYREVLEPRIKEGARGVDLARQLDRAPNVVRMQLSRGLELLRRALPTGLATGAILSISSRRGLASIRSTVLETATAGQPTAATASLLTGGWIVSKKLYWAITALFVLAGTSWVLWGDRHPEATSRTDIADAPTSTPPAMHTPGVVDASTSRSPAESDGSPRGALSIPVTTAFPESYQAELAGMRGRLLTHDRIPIRGIELTLLELHVDSLLPSVETAFSAAVAEPRIEVAQSVTDEDGRFQLAGAHASTLHGLGVDLGGSRATFVPLDVALRRGVESDIGDVVLAPALPVSGLIVDATGQPVPNARIRVVPLTLPLASFGAQYARSDSVLIPDGTMYSSVISLPDWILRFVDRSPFPTARTDPHGRFQVEAVERGMLTVIVDKDGFHPTVRGPFPTGGGAERDLGSLTLETGVTVSGVVLSPDGDPIPFAEVAIGVLPELGGIASARPTTTGVDGRFNVTGFPELCEVLAATRRAGGSLWTIAGPFDEDEDLELILPLVVNHRITLSDGRGLVSGAELRLIPSSDFADPIAFMMPSRELPVDITEEDTGTYLLSDITPGDYHLVTRTEVHGANRHRLHVTEQEGSTAVQITPVNQHVVHVLDHDTGHPIHHALVTALGSDREIALSLRRTDIRGSVKLALSAAESDVQLRVAHPGYAVAYDTLSAAEGRTEVRLDRGGTIRGRLMEDGASPAAPMMIVLQPDLLVAGPDSIVPRTEVTSLTGAFSFVGLPVGRFQYAVYPRAFSGAPMQSYVEGQPFRSVIARGRVEVRRGEVTELVIDLDSDRSSKFGSVSGRVTRNRAPWTHIRVSVVGQRTKYVDLDTQGRYRIGGLPAGQHHLMLFDTEGGVMNSICNRAVSLAAGEEREENFDFESADVRIEVLRSDGSPAVGVAVKMIGVSNSTHALHAETETGERGQANLTALRAGEYRFDASDPDTGVGQATAVVPVGGLTAPVIIHLESGVPCAGKVMLTGDLTGRPIEVGQIHVSGGDLGPGGSLSVAVEAGTGKFRATGLAPGTYNALLMMGPLFTHTVGFQLPTGGSENLVLEFSKGTSVR